MVRETRGRLTDDLDILASFLVMLASAADPVGEAVTLMSEGLTPLTRQSARHQLILKREDQYAADTKRDRQALTPTYIFHPCHLLQSPPITPCRGCAPRHLPGALWGQSGKGRGVQHWKPLLQIHRRWEPPAEEELEGSPPRLVR